MAKRSNVNPSIKQRREMAQQKKQARQRQLRFGGAAVLLLITAAIIWAAMSSPAPEPTVLEGERPLAALAPAQRADFYDAYPETVIDAARTYEAIITMANGSEMRLALFADAAPQAVNSFVFLANQGYYDGVTFHRVIDGFMAQGGDPTGSGGGGPGYNFADEIDSSLTFDRPGLLAMANTGQPSSNGSQFFITYAPTPHLNGRHTIFGELLEGQEVLNGLTRVEPGPLGGPSGGDVIARIDIVEN
jgi:peptidylprolyl isomerase